ncbi:MAG: amidohydrolase family protein [Nitrospirae bacterium]|nr:amidohydrolase family protein [Nitrospirota bacterium]
MNSHKMYKDMKVADAALDYQDLPEIRDQLPGKKVIDIHLHLFGTGDSGSGCRISEEFLASPVFKEILRTLKLSPKDIRDEQIKEKILNEIAISRRTDYAILLALDGVYKNGKYVEDESHLIVPNDYVVRIAATRSRLLFGASVHPFRDAREMLAETRRCIDGGAALFNWMPSLQQIDPEDDRCIPFYICLAREGIPLLCHTGSEFTVSADGSRAYSYGDPEKLRRALDCGLKVILSHCSMSEAIAPAGADYFEKLIDMMKMAHGMKWDLYLDISDFCTPAGVPYLERIKSEIRQGTVGPERFLYGSNFPLIAHNEGMSGGMEDPKGLPVHTAWPGFLDRNYRVIEMSGMHSSVFTNAWDVLGMQKKSVFAPDPFRGSAFRAGMTG